MNILVIESSPHKKGSSNLLASEFIRGAREKGHSITIFDAGHADIKPCLGCGACGMSGECIQKDAMYELKREILSSDMVVFVTPLYYFGFSAQLKHAIDRFYSFNGELQSKQLDSALIVAAWDDNDWTVRDISAHYSTLCRYLNFNDRGQILGRGCGTVSMTKSSAFMKKAYELGGSI